MIDRRTLLIGTAATIASGPAFAQARRNPFEAIRAETGGRLGLAVHDSGTGRRLSLDADSRFAMCSTFKAPLAAAILARADAGRLDLAQMIRFGEGDLVGHSPTTSANVAAGQLSIEALCEAAVTVSDNGAANLLLPQLGGPAGLTRFFREQRDTVTRLDRDEPSLNLVRGGDVRDTTTPQAMAALLEHLFTANTLSPASRDKLLGWMRVSTTGLARLRAGLPKSWQVGDKTGTSGEGYVNDIAIATPPGRKPIFIACYLDAPGLAPAKAEEAHARIGSLIGDLFA
ncbi:class A beta-lactamase [Sphingomonas sp. 37zxx]|uniref:class A beta-lactamase n=1 Tax=Sphingomonas sp. 37zxx TaxID=1550073 RepID=UPI00053BFC2E|nr:class A beta-lactamase [Sphingomonas sp. 37zxx]